MGKNIYETPRDRNKWSQEKTPVDKHHQGASSSRADRLEALKKRRQAQKKSSRD